MPKPLTYSLFELERLLPITSRDLVLRWLKERYGRAEDAMDYGFNGAVVIQRDGFMVTAEELLQYIDIKHGSISPASAAFLIRLIDKEVLPASLRIFGKPVAAEFRRYAFGQPQTLQQSG